MRITKKQLRRIILSELQSQRARDDVSAGSDRDDLKGHERPDLELDESDADEGEHKEDELNETRRLSYRQLRRIIREEFGGGAHEYKRDDGHRTGDVGGHYKDYEGAEGGNLGDESKTDPGHLDYEDDATGKAHAAIAAIHDLASAAGVDLDISAGDAEDLEQGGENEEMSMVTAENRRRMKRSLRRIVRENTRRRR
jgi:hypothetical protein